MDGERKDSLDSAALRTTDPVRPDDFSQATKEFGRTKDVERVFSIKRGTLYSAEKRSRPGRSAQASRTEERGETLGHAVG